MNYFVLQPPAAVGPGGREEMLEDDKGEGSGEEDGEDGWEVVSRKRR